MVRRRSRISRSGKVQIRGVYSRRSASKHKKQSIIIHTLFRGYDKRSISECCPVLEHGTIKYNLRYPSWYQFRAEFSWSDSRIKPAILRSKPAAVTLMPRTQRWIRASSEPLYICNCSSMRSADTILGGFMRSVAVKILWSTKVTSIM